MAVDHQNLPSSLSNSNFNPAADIPTRTSSSHGLLSNTNPSIPRRKSSKRPMSQDSGDWFAGKKPAMATVTGTTTAGPSTSRPTTKDKSMSPQTSPPRQKRSSVQMTSPPPDPPKGFGDEFIYHQDNTWTAEKEKILLGPFDYLFGHPGKDIRSQLIAAFNAWLKVPQQSLEIITKVIGMLHTASLLVDDVEDSSLLRRGIPVAHSIFGTPQTLNSANYVYFLALQSLTQLQNPACLHIYTEELLNLHRGQGMDLFWRDTLTCPSESDYLEMVANKTGGLFRLAIKLMQAESQAPQPVNCVPLVNTIGMLFQILDDLLNLQSPTYTARKGLCEDLTEGKFSFPIIHAIRAEAQATSTSSAGNMVTLNILRMKTKDDEVKRYAVGHMEKLGSFEYTRSVLRVLEEKAVALIEGMQGEIGGEDGKAGAERIKAILGKLKAL